VSGSSAHLDLLERHELHAGRVLFLETKCNHFADSWDQFFERPCLRVTTRQRRDSRNVVTVLILFDDDPKLVVQFDVEAALRRHLTT
jgi:hypothetical protein